MFKVDLHTHSIFSPDGGLTTANYQRALENGIVDYIAVTDHNHVDFAIILKRELGDKIIVGEEIMSADGEIIGLFLDSVVPAGLAAADTIAAIKAQGGLVYVPHPFETVRKGLHPGLLEELQDQIDIIEVCNGRAFAQNRSQQAVVWAKLNHIPGAASSDAHGIVGLGRTYSMISQPPTAQNLVELMASATLFTDRPPWRSLLYPKYHRLRKRVKKDRA